MKLTLFLILAGLLQVSATVYSQNTKFSLDIRGKQVAEVLKQIEEESNFRFFYQREQVDVTRTVNLKITGKTVEEILDLLFEGEGITYKVMEDNLVLLRSEKNQNEKNAPSQQQKSVTGKVTSTSGEPLPGVTVVVKGTTTGNITNSDGTFVISNIPPEATLVFSFVGMKTQEVKVEGKTTINVSLAEDAIGIEEVVAIGYGTVKKSDLTGAVVSISGNLIEERKTTQISQALQGAMPGVMVTRSSNAPGSTAEIRVRGVTTIGDSNPLIIVDGVPVNNINDINPNDVEALSVLKDAASASIYGSRAAAGVILVTTKRAKSGELNLDYNMEYGFESPTTLPEFVDVIRLMQIENELRWNDNGNNANEYPTYSKNLIDNYLSLNSENPDLYPNTDWIGLILKKYAPRESHSLSASAGTSAIRSKLSIAYDKTDALYMGRTYERITSRFNNDLTISKFLTATMDMYFRRAIHHQPSINPMDYMLQSSPNYAAEWTDGRVAEGKGGSNVYGQIKYGGFINNWNNQVGGKFSIDLTPLNGLKLSAIISPNLEFNKEKNFQKKVPYYAWNDPTLYMGLLRWNPATNLYENRNDNYQVTTQFLTSYSKSINEHSFNAMGGYENYYAFYENLGASREQYDLTSYPYLNLGPLTYRGNSGNAWENAYRSWFGRVIYNYKNKYFLQGNVRYDASSRFHEDYRWGSFPSFSAGWVISEESFMKNMQVLNYLKLRASIGNLGNERIGNYPYQATIAFSNALLFQGSKVVANQTAAQTQYAIRDISWEKTESIDIGLDAGLFNNHLRITGDYYKKTTKDMLLALEIPDYIGFDNPDQNTGKMNTKGWELDLSYNNSIRDLNYSFALNMSDFQSVMGDLGGTEFLGDQIKKEGSEFNEWYGYSSDGLYQTQEEVANLPKLNASVKPGDVKYLDISGPDGVPDAKITPEYDRILLGGSLPRYIFGGNLRLDYKGFDFSLAIQGVGKQNTRLAPRVVQPLSGGEWGNIPKILDGHYWSVYNTKEENEKAKYPRMSLISKGNNYAMSDYWLFNGAYLRIKNLSLGYTLPQNALHKLAIKNVRIYSTISDLFTFNQFPKGWDPEVSATGYPITTSIVFGLSVKF